MWEQIKKKKIHSKNNNKNKRAGGASVTFCADVLTG